jgi:hypothetical protein
MTSSISVIQPCTSVSRTVHVGTFRIWKTFLLRLHEKPMAWPPHSTISFPCTVRHFRSSTQPCESVSGINVQLLGRNMQSIERCSFDLSVKIINTLVDLPPAGLLAGRWPASVLLATRWHWRYLATEKLIVCRPTNTRFCDVW